MSNPQWPGQSSDPYGQPQYGQPAYGQPLYGQQPDFGPPQYATPAYGPRPSFSAHLGQSPPPPGSPRSKGRLVAAICAGAAIALALVLVVVVINHSGDRNSQVAHSGTIAERVARYWEAGDLDDLVELTCAADHPYLSDGFNTNPESFKSGAYTNVRTGPVHRHGYLYAVPVMFKFQGGYYTDLTPVVKENDVFVVCMDRYDAVLNSYLLNDFDDAGSDFSNLSDLFS